MLGEQIRSFFQSLTGNQKVIELAVQLQQQLEKGHTAMAYNEWIEDELISNDGSYGYIVQHDGLAAFRRFFNQEKAIAADFKNSQSIEINSKELTQAKEYVCKMLNLSTIDNHDKQWQASLEFLQHSRYILSGGPGTGKTSTVIRMLLMYIYLNPKANIALAAPTGKAANHMMQSMNNLLPKDLQQTAQTLHRLLGFNHQKNTVKYNQNNPLPYDLIIIDEASMLDVTIAYRIIQALKPNAQLLLVGDKNQLPSVEAGNVFANLCKMVQSNYKELTENFRFSHDSIISKLCQSVINQDLKRFNKHCPSNNPQSTPDKFTALQHWYKKVGKEPSVILSPTKFGNNSVTELNELAIQILYNNNKLNDGMPIMVSKNDYTLNVFNGDIGSLQFNQQKWFANFTIEGVEKSINLEAINRWQVAHAITIHKSQGSEYDHVLIVLPDDLELEILTSSLLYTAISRAKKSITIWSSQRIFAKTLLTTENRMTFLN